MKLFCESKNIKYFNVKVLKKFNLMCNAIRPLYILMLQNEIQLILNYTVSYQ
jgi:hypothetical protein